MSLSEGGFGGGAVTISSHLFIAGGGGGYSGGQGALENSNFPGGAGGSYYDPNLVKNFTVGPKYSGKGKVFVKFRPEYIGEEALYPFKSFTFNTGKYTTGRHGPDLENVREIYAKEDSTLWTNNDDYFSMNPNRQGIQIWTVPKSGMYQFNVYGPSGKDPQNDNLKGYRSGYGYNVYGDVYLIANEKIHIACGQYGDSIITQSGTAVGGSGGTFVVKEDDTPLIIVGGASGLLNGYGGTFNGKGTQSTFYSNGVAWSTNESGGAYLNDGRALGSGSTNNSYGQNGAGFYADADSLGGLGWSPKGWVNGLTGGEVPGGVWYGSGYHQVVGGFGGGGASFIDSTGYVRSGAGGGYSGGGGSYFWNYSTGGAGGSYYNTKLVANFTRGGTYSGPGKVIVKYKGAFTPWVKKTVLYAFDSFTFRTETPGAIGPTLETLKKLYKDTKWTQIHYFLNMDSKRQGIQIWTVPKTGYYKFDVSGAGGNDTLGDYTSGASSKLTGYVKLKMNEKIHIACGQNSQRWGIMAGGHGGTFVVKEDGTPLIISGGGSGGINHQSGGTPRKKTNGISTLTSFNSKGVAFSTDQNGDNHLDTGYGGKVLKHEPGGTGAGLGGMVRKMNQECYNTGLMQKAGIMD